VKLTAGVAAKTSLVGQEQCDSNSEVNETANENDILMKA
jgi:hypothetical protein